MKDVFGEDFLKLNSEPRNIGGLPGYEDRTPEEQNEILIRMFRDVFNSEEGRLVLTVILEDLYYFATCNNDEARALNNYAKVLLSQRLGINKNKEMIDKLLAI